MILFEDEEFIFDEDFLILCQINRNESKKY